MESRWRRESFDSDSSTSTFQTPLHLLQPSPPLSQSPSSSIPKPPPAYKASRARAEMAAVAERLASPTTAASSLLSAPKPTTPVSPNAGRTTDPYAVLSRPEVTSSIREFLNHAVSGLGSGVEEQQEKDDGKGKGKKGRRVGVGSSVVFAPLVDELEAMGSGLDDMDDLEGWNDPVETPGYVMGVVHGGAVIWREAVGYSHPVRGTAINCASTVFPLGSVSRLFTAAGAAVMTEHHHLNWDQSILDRVEEEYTMVSAVGDLPLDDLLAGVGGIGPVHGWGELRWNSSAVKQLWELERDYFVAEGADKRPLRLEEVLPMKIGMKSMTYQHWCPSPWAWALVGSAMESVLYNETFEEYLETLIFHNLDMDHTGFYPDDAAAGGAHVMKGYQMRSGPTKAWQDTVYYRSRVPPFSGIYTTMDDLCLFLVSLLTPTDIVGGDPGEALHAALAFHHTLKGGVPHSPAPRSPLFGVLYNSPEKPWELARALADAEKSCEHHQGACPCLPPAADGRWWEVPVKILEGVGDLWSEVDEALSSRSSLSSDADDDDDDDDNEAEHGSDTDGDDLDRSRVSDETELGPDESSIPSPTSSSSDMDSSSRSSGSGGSRQGGASTHESGDGDVSRASAVDEDEDDDDDDDGDDDQWEEDETRYAVLGIHPQCHKESFGKPLLTSRSLDKLWNPHWQLDGRLAGSTAGGMLTTVIRGRRVCWMVGVGAKWVTSAVVFVPSEGLAVGWSNNSGDVDGRSSTQVRRLVLGVVRRLLRALDEVNKGSEPRGPRYGKESLRSASAHFLVTSEELLSNGGTGSEETQAVCLDSDGKSLPGSVAPSRGHSRQPSMASTSFEDTIEVDGNAVSSATSGGTTAGSPSSVASSDNLLPPTPMTPSMDTLPTKQAPPGDSGSEGPLLVMDNGASYSDDDDDDDDDRGSGELEGELGASLRRKKKGAGKPALPLKQYTGVYRRATKSFWEGLVEMWEVGEWHVSAKDGGLVVRTSWEMLAFRRGRRLTPVTDARLCVGLVQDVHAVLGQEHQEFCCYCLHEAISKLYVNVSEFVVEEPDSKAAVPCPRIVFVDEMGEAELTGHALRLRGGDGLLSCGEDGLLKLHGLVRKSSLGERRGKMKGLVAGLGMMKRISFVRCFIVLLGAMLLAIACIARLVMA